MSNESRPFHRELLKLGQGIKRLRQEQNLTQEELAQRAQMNTSYLAKIERGMVNTSVRYLIKIARGLKINPSELFE